MGKLFGYYKLECNDLDVIRETLTKEQGFDLICALVDYSRDGTTTELPAELRIPFAMLKKKVDQAHKVYEDKCNTLKENGRKGGRAKAKNAAKAAGPAPDQAKKFKPPTIKQFKNAVEEITYENDWNCPNDYSIESFYDHLNEHQWLFEGMPIQSRNDWEAIITAKFSTQSDHHVPNVFYASSCYLISEYPQLHHRWSDIDEITDQLCESWNENRGTWVIEGREYQRGDFKEALDFLVREWLKEIPP